jgi:CheY-like chemotaxis protein
LRLASRLNERRGNRKEHLTVGYVTCHIRGGNIATPAISTRTNHPPVPEPTPGTKTPNLSGEGRAIILVVERDPHIRELESYFLNEAGFTVDFAADGLVALERARELQPDIIITEVLVPKLDGLALCRTVKADPQLQHIVMLVFSILAVQSRASEAGADAFLMKPLAEKRLVDTVRQLLRVRQTSDQNGVV